MRSVRLDVLLVWIAVLAIGIGFWFLVGWGVSKAIGATPKPDNPPLTIKIGTAAYAESCPTVKKAVGFYRRAYTKSREAMGLPGAVPRVWYGCEASARRAMTWRFRAKQAREALAAWTDYHYNWERWLPSNWRAVAICETSLNWEHSNSQFTSAFGISWAEYNADAAYMGAPSWGVRHTPRDQYLAALGHYRRFGDGWTCPGP